MPRDVLLELDGSIGFVTLNRPERLNALTPGWVEDFVAALDTLAGCAFDPVRVVIVRAAGRAFCAGADLKEHPVFSLDDPEERRRVIDRGYEVIERIRALPMPVVAAVQGPCAGAGMSVAVACDLRVAADNARFSLDFVRLGVVPDMGASYYLPHVVGAAKAMELALLAEPVGADEAHRIGLVNRVVSEAALWPEAERMAARIAGMPPLAVREVKRLVRELPALPVHEALQDERETLNRLIGTPECRTAVAAFAERTASRASS
jgi:2-(1,2-epoxy-1,2-dihydrophenyl)acetyl-CoA isomerase